jgi:ribonuclease P protein component
MQTLKASADFQRTAREGRKWTGTAFVMQVLKTDSTQPFRLGLTASRRVGGAVQRNRAKRRLREMTRAHLRAQNLSGCDIVLIAKTAAITMDFAAMGAEFKTGLSKLGIGA